jgi:hypothetical protein
MPTDLAIREDQLVRLDVFVRTAVTLFLINRRYPSVFLIEDLFIQRQCDWILGHKASGFVYKHQMQAR